MFELEQTYLKFCKENVTRSLSEQKLLRRVTLLSSKLKLLFFSSASTSSSVSIKRPYENRHSIIVTKL